MVIPVVREYIGIKPGFCGGKPHVLGHRIKVQHIAVWHERMGMTPEEIVVAYPGLSLPAVYAALSYYHGHQAEIDADIEADERFVAELKAKAGLSSTSITEKKQRSRGVAVARAVAVRIDLVGCGDGVPSASAFCVSGHVCGLGAGDNGYSVCFEIVNQSPGDSAYDCSESTPVNMSTSPPSWSFGPGAINPLDAAQDVVLTVVLYQNGSPVKSAGSDSQAFTLNP
jgi:uncharacterized protein (DUF433 family)